MMTLVRESRTPIGLKSYRYPQLSYRIPGEHVRLGGWFSASRRNNFRSICFGVPISVVSYRCELSVVLFRSLAFTLNVRWPERLQIMMVKSA